MNRRRKSTATKYKSISKDPTISRFVSLAQSYCDLIESGTTRQKWLLRECAELLPHLFAVAIELPPGRENKKIRQELDLITRDDWPVFGLSKAQRRKAATSRYRHTVIPTKRFFKVSRRLAKILGTHNLYREIFDPYTNKDPNETSLSNDLAEIWHDIKPALLLFQLRDETAKRHAVHKWAISVRIHWGPSHFPGALKAVLYALCDVDRDWQYPEFNNQRRIRRNGINLTE